MSELMRWSTVTTGIATMVLMMWALTVPTPALADSDDNPCGFNFLCRMIPVAPDLDGDIDLTRIPPPGLGGAPAIPPMTPAAPPGGPETPLAPMAAVPG